MWTPRAPRRLFNRGRRRCAQSIFEPANAEIMQRGQRTHGRSVMGQAI